MRPGKIHYWPDGRPLEHVGVPIFEPHVLWCRSKVSIQGYEWTSDIGKVTCRVCQNMIVKRHNKPA